MKSPVARLTTPMPNAITTNAVVTSSARTLTRCETRPPASRTGITRYPGSTRVSDRGVTAH